MSLEQLQRIFPMHAREQTGAVLVPGIVRSCLISLKCDFSHLNIRKAQLDRVCWALKRHGKNSRCRRGGGESATARFLNSSRGESVGGLSHNAPPLIWWRSSSCTRDALETGRPRRA
ncbi:hypothetical protein AA313_de0205207 [Arthrobotrys entomopaga]|nr:hypothetical protein AA313_de0205207 [Arthrobotrys entomopaga]